MPGPINVGCWRLSCLTTAIWLQCVAVASRHFSAPQNASNMDNDCNKDTTAMPARERSDPGSTSQKGRRFPAPSCNKRHSIPDLMSPSPHETVEMSRDRTPPSCGTVSAFAFVPRGRDRPWPYGLQLLSKCPVSKIPCKACCNPA